MSKRLLIRSELTSNCQEKRPKKVGSTKGRGLDSVNSKLQQVFTSLETGVTQVNEHNYLFISIAVLRIFIKSFGTKDRPGGGSIFGDTVIEVNGINHRKRVSILAFVLCYLVRL